MKKEVPERYGYPVDYSNVVAQDVTLQVRAKTGKTNLTFVHYSVVYI